MKTEAINIRTTEACRKKLDAVVVYSQKMVDVRTTMTSAIEDMINDKYEELKKQYKSRSK